MITVLCRGTLLPDSDGQSRRWPSWRLYRGLQVEIEKSSNGTFIAAAHGLRGVGNCATLAIDHLLVQCARLAHGDVVPPRWVRQHLEPNSPIFLPRGMEWGDRWKIERLTRVQIEFSWLEGVWYALPPRDAPPTVIGIGWSATSAIECLLNLWVRIAGSRRVDTWPMNPEYYDWVCRTLRRRDD